MPVSINFQQALLYQYIQFQQLNQDKMNRLNNTIFQAIHLNTILSYAYRIPKQQRTFKARIAMYNRNLDRYDRVFLIRPPNLESKNPITFPIKIPMRVRHIYNPKKRNSQFLDNTQKIHWNRLTPNQILLAFERLQCLQYSEVIEGLRYLSEVPGQQNHDWNSHAWISKALDYVNNNFKRIKNTDYLSMYYLMKKLNYKSQDYWKKIYSKIEDMIYDLYPSEFQRFFLKYYKVSDQYFSPEMKDKFLSLMEGRLRSFQPKSIISVFEFYLQENKLNDYWIHNVFIPLFKSEQYTYKPEELYKILRFMLILNHEKDDRLFESLYKRLMSYEKLTLQQVKMLEEVIDEIKDLFITHRVDSYIKHLAEMKVQAKVDSTNKKKEIPIHQIVRQDLVFFLHKKKLEGEKVNQPIFDGNKSDNPQQQPTHSTA